MPLVMPALIPIPRAPHCSQSFCNRSAVFTNLTAYLSASRASNLKSSAVLRSSSCRLSVRLLDFVDVSCSSVALWRHLLISFSSFSLTEGLLWPLWLSESSVQVIIGFHQWLPCCCSGWSGCCWRQVPRTGCRIPDCSQKSLDVEWQYIVSKRDGVVDVLLPFESVK